MSKTPLGFVPARDPNNALDVDLNQFGNAVKTTLELGPIGARAVRAGFSFVQQKSKNAFIFRPFRRFQQAEKTASPSYS